MSVRSYLSLGALAGLAFAGASCLSPRDFQGQREAVIYSTTSINDQPVYGGYAFDFDRDGQYDAAAVFSFEKRNGFIPTNSLELNERLTDGLANLVNPGVMILAPERYAGQKEKVRKDITKTLGIAVHTSIPIEVLDHTKSADLMQHGIDNEQMIRGILKNKAHRFH